MAQYLPLPVTYVPRDSFFHRLYPLTKLLWAICALVLAFATRNPLILGIVFLLGLACVAIAGVMRNYGRVMAVLLPISSSLIVFQAIAPAFPQPWIPITSLGPFTIYQEGIYSGISLLLRAWAGVNFAALLVLTTHPSDLFASLQKIGVPHELNFMVSASIQLIPIVQREFTIILSAQRSRGMKATGLGAAIPSIVPVFAGTIERVQQLAMSLESRAFGSKGQKTSLRDMHPSALDYIGSVLGVLVTAAGVYAAVRFRDELDWSEIPFIPAWLSIALVILATVTFLGILVYLWWRSRR